MSDSDLFNSESSDSTEEVAGSDSDYDPSATPSASVSQTSDSEPPDLQDDIAAGAAPSASDSELPSSDPDLSSSESLVDVVIGPNPSPSASNYQSVDPELPSSSSSEGKDDAVPADHPSVVSAFDQALDSVLLYLWIVHLMHSEMSSMPSRHLTADLATRRWAIQQILEVSRSLGFLPSTACLAVSFLNRYLSAPAAAVSAIYEWRLLLAVCLSTAARSKETQVNERVRSHLASHVTVGCYDPLDLNLMESRFFTNLDWSLQSVTPFDFLGEFAMRLDSGHFMELFNIASRNILNALSDDDFLAYPPSAQAASAIILAAEQSSGEPDTFEQYGEFLSNYFTEGAIRSVRESYELMLPFAWRRREIVARPDEPETSEAGSRRGERRRSPSDERDGKRDSKRPRIDD